ncbi:protein adenylyltransferase SelO [Shewanella fidelis]|uniref:Protein nucleotidyltransferase YdiU n=1 Tax=Shewanella fidelis TaxID=173509 RepID=A0AAW8NTJ1_9GAMM|nr:YdiU family protein [Shewanella fidelis]MDR8526152.1 YdiU family protein [Shewanella fidelis]MDW4813765.1 YdiU family protein [Shewanella fidelis]MDW4817861.1 YdiU family protein [Shewanella fidelis]MDW4821878.1 YdiU family protein [Shewanella fidelis]MDW4826093.1 YdiU family protein [Shewanella fidelis]
MQLKQDFFEQLPEFYSQVFPLAISNPHWLAWSQDAADLIAIETPSEALLQGLSGNAKIPDASYYAQVYSGHQFGGYSPQLGDGRSIIVGEAIGPQGAWDVALKGGGPTPYSRHGDGRAVMRSAVREFLISEALHQLHVPTTRALAVIGSDLPVWRETQETAAITVRLAKSHIRFGHFEFFCHSERGAPDKLKQLLNFTIKQHYPQLTCDAAGYKAWFTQVVADTAKMIAHWQAIGFAHGVMNTDNMSILGDSFDFGPFAFLDTFKEDFICNHSDPEGRYAFSQQPGIGLWNLQRLAQALAPIIASDDLIAALNQYQVELVQHYLYLMRAKLGITDVREDSALDETDLELIGGFTTLMERNQLDYTNTLRRFGQLDPDSKHSSLRDDFIDLNGFDTWFTRYQARVGKVLDVAQWQLERNKINPKYILRNYLAQEAIIAVEEGNLAPLHQLQQVLQNPFAEQPEFDEFANRPPDWGQGLIMSCSS